MPCLCLCLPAIVSHRTNKQPILRFYKGAFAESRRFLFLMQRLEERRENWQLTFRFLFKPVCAAGSTEVSSLKTRSVICKCLRSPSEIREQTKLSSSGRKSNTGSDCCKPSSRRGKSRESHEGLSRKRLALFGCFQSAQGFLTERISWAMQLRRMLLGRLGRKLHDVGLDQGSPADTRTPPKTT